MPHFYNFFRPKFEADTLPLGPSIPGIPGIPVKPSLPLSPDTPGLPWGPGKPLSPLAPGRPGKPVSPVSPLSPLSPSSPGNPGIPLFRLIKIRVMSPNITFPKFFREKTVTTIGNYLTGLFAMATLGAVTHVEMIIYVLNCPRYYLICIIEEYMWGHLQ